MFYASRARALSGRCFARRGACAGTRRGRFFERRTSHESARRGIHLAFSRLRIVVVADEVQEAVRKEKAHLCKELTAARGGLAKCGVDRDDDVAEPRARGIFALFIEGEGEDVGRLVLLPVLAIQLVNRSVVREQDAELGVRKFERAQHGLREAAHDAR